MSLEILKIVVGGRERWRCANENSGMFSLDQHTIEPFVDTSDEAIKRLYAALLEMKEEECSNGPQYWAEMREHVAGLNNYRRGACVYDLDGFFFAVDQITTICKARELSLNAREVEHLKSMATAIQQEILGDKAWVRTVERLDPELQETIYVKLFPDYDPERGTICHKALDASLVLGLDSGFRYIDFLQGSSELAV